jgi:hypothetical protein
MQADTDDWVFWSIYVDPDVDEALRTRAASEGVSKGAMFRRFFQSGLEQVDNGKELLAGRDGICLAMRAVYFPPNLYERLLELASARRMKKLEVVRQLLRLGMDALCGSHGPDHLVRRGGTAHSRSKR